MSANRLIDREIDALNPRTAHRLAATGKISPRRIMIYLFIFAALFILTARLLNPLSFYLSFICIGAMLIYPYLKRYTSLCHFLLGFILSCGPAGAWIAVRGSLEWTAVWLSLSVFFWVAGFDILYAIQDYNFDRQNRLYSIPALLGCKKAFMLSRLCHASVPFFWTICGLSAELGQWFYISLGVLCLLLFYEHYSVHKGFSKNIGLAFFRLNAIISFSFFTICIMEVFFWQK
jgi:4-hydroxybenzoate polyprenyltransferase